jgi:hypothetical protein
MMPWSSRIPPLSIQPGWDAACSCSRKAIQPLGELAGAAKEALQRGRKCTVKKFKLLEDTRQEVSTATRVVEY